MSIFHSVIDNATTVVLAAGDPPAAKAMDTNTGADVLVKIRNFIMPFVLIAIAAISLTFLVRRQMSQFLQFIGISIAVIALVYSPTIIAEAAKAVAGFFG